MLMKDPIDSQNPNRDGERGAWLPMAGAITGALLLMAGVWFIVVGVPVAYHRTLTALAPTGIADPNAISSDISMALRMAWLGAASGLAGLVTLVVSVVAMRRAGKDEV
jgi:hypothetical protein